jgi:hypothetical protein
MSRFVDLTNQRYGRIVVISYYGYKNGRTAWNCECDCGNKFVTMGHSLRTGKTTSCGCYRHEREIEANIKHGLKDHPLYKIHSRMKGRCYNKNNQRYKTYGARGIKVCDEWLGENGVVNFYNWAIQNGYKEEKLPSGINKYSIDRINNDGNYEPNNCRFTTNIIQARNRTNNRKIKLNNKIQTLIEWCEEFDLDYSLVNKRINNGWEIEKALFKPKGRTKYYNYNNQKLTLKDIAKLTGLKEKTIKSRLDHKWNIDKIINMPYYSKGKRKLLKGAK